MSPAEIGLGMLMQISPNLKNTAENSSKHAISSVQIHFFLGGEGAPTPLQTPSGWLTPSDLPSPVNGILWEMSELITQQRIAVGSSNLVEGLTTWPAMYDRWPKSKGQGHKVTWLLPVDSLLAPNEAFWIRLCVPRIPARFTLMVP